MGVDRAPTCVSPGPRPHQLPSRGGEEQPVGPTWMSWAGEPQGLEEPVGERELRVSDPELRAAVEQSDASAKARSTALRRGVPLAVSSPRSASSSRSTTAKSTMRS